MQVTLQQVADEAGVSPSTVSRVLNNTGLPISEKTRNHVRRIAMELGYQPNPAARALVTGRSYTIVLWTSNLRSAFYGDVIYFGDEKARSHGLELIVSSVPPVKDDGRVNTPKILTIAADGIIAVDLPRGALSGLSNSLLNGTPLVHIGGNAFEKSDSVHINFKNQAADAIYHLANVGCKRIAYLVPNWFEWFEETHDARLEGYKLAIAGLGRNPEWIKAANETRPNVHPALVQHIDRYGCPDGLMCYNDDMAIAACRILKEMGLRIPEDVAVVGCDGMEEASYCMPQISTIVPPIEQMCDVAIELLVRRIETPNRPIQRVVLEAQLDIRGSSLRP